MKRSFCLITLLILIVTFSQVLSDQPTTDDEEFVRTFKYRRMRKGDGKNYPRTGEKVSIHYRGVFAGTQKQFDSSYDRGQALDFTLGTGQVIKCLDETISRMSLGERGVVICPSRFAYGKEGKKGKISPDTDLQYEIEVLKFRGLYRNAMEL